ncbi:MAG: NAD(P)/FAD-dependent oxidoreductase [Pirellula sp.]
MQTYDVLIVGAGPSGSTCARKLCQSGLRTLVIDRKDFPRDKPCAGWITPQVVQLLELDVNEYSREHTCQPITGFRCGVIGGTEIEIDYQEPISFGIRRSEFDHFLLQRSGTEQRLNETVDRIERHGGNWVINDRYRAPILVGAGGTHCPVARMLGAKANSSRSTVVAQEVEFRIRGEMSAQKVMGNIPVLYFCRDLLGYGWCFRKGEYLNIGLGRVDATDFMHHVSQFQEFVTEQGIQCVDVGFPWKGHSYQLYVGAERKLSAEGVLLLGDAAGLAYAQSGEGIRPAVESGGIAAGVIIAAHGNYTPENLSRYQSLLEQRLGKPIRASLLNQLPTSWLASLGSCMLASPWFSRHIVLDRWFLHRADKAG